MLAIALPWPHKDLSPNARVHWAVKSQRVSRAKADAYVAVRAMSCATVYGKPGLRIHYEFNPADKRRRDLDNLIASTKAYTDGIARALGVDDSTFKLSYEMGITFKPATVIVMIQEAA